jgi:hypothetical protein
MTIKQENYNILKKIMTDASALKQALNSIPLNKVNNAIKPYTYNPHIPTIKEKATSFSEEIKSLSFEIPTFDDGNFCSIEEVIGGINHGVYNVVGLCYNKAILTIYNNIKENFDDNAVSIALSHSLNNFDRSFMFDDNIRAVNDLLNNGKDSYIFNDADSDL